MNVKLASTCSIAAVIVSQLVISAKGVDLLERYPTQWSVGDSRADHARGWVFGASDIFRVSGFEFKVGDNFTVKTDAADLGIGHCEDGAVWALLIPREQGTLTSSANNHGEAITHVWFRFHPGQINVLFPPDTVFADGAGDLAAPMRSIANGKITTSWQAGGKALLSGPNEMTVFVDTKDDSHRFFMVDTKAKTAEYVAEFNRRSGAAPDHRPAAPRVSATSYPPVVVKTIPEAGSDDVSPGECEIKVTFSKEMTDQSWSWSTAWEKSDPAYEGNPHYEGDHKTCVWKANLAPNHTYGVWLNSDKFHGFKDSKGRNAVPYLLVFKTKGS
jgi:RNA polymerase sigma-70 factor (ECF subfamily)